MIDEKIILHKHLFVEITQKYIHVHARISQVSPESGVAPDCLIKRCSTLAYYLTHSPCIRERSKLLVAVEPDATAANLQISTRICRPPRFNREKQACY